MKIYIPLWFYSNKRVELLLLCVTRFTFHYGSILIASTIWYLASLNSFTFHYGSILIKILNRFIYIIAIYIPLWFYSNLLLCLAQLEKTLIYIPLWFYSNRYRLTKNFSIDNIYIPLWFYSNTSWRKAAYHRTIYIPLWFYSNEKNI